MLRKRIQGSMAGAKRTLLSVGPMSVNCIDVAIELAQSQNSPLTLIASRRQIDAKIFGGGYVGGFDTFQFAQYVRDRDPQRRVVLGRDHGGPWQNEDLTLTLSEAMASAKRSLTVDIQAGFQLIHLDTSIDPKGTPSVDEILRRIFELHDFCSKEAVRLGREIEVEFGPLSSDLVDELATIDWALQQIEAHCRKNQLKMPLYVVVNTGTKVMEMRNVGCFESMILGAKREKIKALAALCERYKVFLKEHNSDYLSFASISAHPMLNIHSANIAPELGVIETESLLGLIKQLGREDLYDQFVNLAVDSLKWQKWMLPDTTASREYRGKIAGHYVYSHPQAVTIKGELCALLQAKGIGLDEYLRRQIRSRVEEYLNNFSSKA